MFKIDKIPDPLHWLEERPNWIFDLDETLYPSESRLFDQVETRITDFVAKITGLEAVKARALQKRYLYDHGTTMNGLMQHHQTDPQDFLRYVHDIDFSPIQKDTRLRAAMSRLPGKRYVFTNADIPYAQKILERLGIADLIDGLFDITRANYIPKPAPETYTRFLKAHDINPHQAVMIDDMARNLSPAYKAGMATVWIDTGSPWGRSDFDKTHIHTSTTSLSEWLDTLTQKHKVDTKAS